MMRILDMAKSKRIPFSERNGYVKPSNVFILKKVPASVSNAICSALMRVVQKMEDDPFLILGKVKPSEELSQYIWSHFFNDNILSYDYESKHCWKRVAELMNSQNVEWHRKIDFIEFIIERLNTSNMRKMFVEELNDQFESLGFGYRIIENYVVDIVSENEILSIEEAIENSNDQVSHHMSNAMSLYSKRPNPDYANSIKEAISAVEAQLRIMTCANTFGDALSALQKTNMKIHPRLKEILDKLYAYTNQPDTGARHSLMNTDSEFIPGSEEALFVIVTCSAAVNFLRTKEIGVNIQV